MIFSAQQALFDTKTCIASGAAGESANNKASGSSEASKQGSEGADFLNLLVQAAAADAGKKGNIRQAAGKNETGSAEAQLKDRLLDFLKSNYPSEILKNVKEGDKSEKGFLPGEILEELQNLLDQEYGAADLLQVLALQLQSGQNGSDASSGVSAAGGRGESYLRFVSKMSEFLKSIDFSTDTMNPAEGSNKSPITDIQARLRAIFSNAEGKIQDTGRNAGASQQAFKFLESLNSRGLSSDKPVSADGLKNGGATETRERFGNLFSGSEGKGHESDILRKSVSRNSASKILELSDVRAAVSDSAKSADGIRPEGLKQGGQNDAAGRIQALFSDSGDKSAGNIRDILAGMKEHLHSNPGVSETGKQAVKNKGPEKAGNEILDITRFSTGGNEKSDNSTTAVRQSNKAFDRQLQFAESRLVSQVSVRLSAGVKNGSRNMTIQMHPPELGSVRVHIISDSSGLNVHLQPQNSQVAGVLERHLPGLQQSLADQGVSVTDLQVSVNSGGDHENPGFEDHRFGAGGGELREGEAAAPEDEPEPETLPRRDSQGLSLRV